MATKNYEHRWRTHVFKSIQLSGSSEDGSGPEITKQSATAVNVPGLAIGGTLLTSTPAELNLIDGADRVTKVVKVALAAATGNAGLLSWQNPESSRILVTRVVLDITTEATGAATADFGADGDGTGTSDTLLDGVNIGAAAGVFDNIDDQGTNGQSVIALDENGGTTDYITGTASADPAGLVGFAYIHYVVI